jgi:2,4-dienoyl-CoA reductase-like NADH-dependent reductase (Old Yellow Enzyme family)
MSMPVRTGPSHEVLRAPLALPCGAVLHNRLVKAAMSEQLADQANDVSGRLTRLYARWARSGCGLLVTGNMMIDRTAISEPRQVVLDRHTDVEALAALAGAARRHGAAIWAQLNHGGRQVPRILSRRATAPSPVRVRASGLFGRPRALTTTEIHEIVDGFARAAAVARSAGFDGLQIHAAHGYLVSQFLSPLTNRREDEWGGDAGRRMRFLLEVVRAVRSAVGPDMPIGVKLNSADFQRGGFDEAESLGVIERLETEGIDLLEISGGTFEAGAMMGARLSERTQQREAYFLRFAEAARRRTTLPLMLTGGFRTGPAMADAVASGTVDLVGVARPLVADPEFADRILEGTASGIALRPRQLGPRQLDALAEVAWYTRQVRHLSRGREPDSGLSVRGALLAHLATTAHQATLRRPASRRVLERRRSVSPR